MTIKEIKSTDTDRLIIILADILTHDKVTSTDPKTVERV